MHRTTMRALLSLLPSALLFTGFAYAEASIQTVKLPFEVGASHAVETRVGALRVTKMGIAPDNAPMFASLLPPRGGQSRYSWLSYSIRVENASDIRHRLGVRVRLLDKNGAVIDEFTFRGRVGKGRYRVLELRRLTLNYIISLVDAVELTLSQE